MHDHMAVGQWGTLSKYRKDVAKPVSPAQHLLACAVRAGLCDLGRYTPSVSAVSQHMEQGDLQYCWGGWRL